MIYSIRHLKEEDVTILEKAIQEFKNHDKLDLIIELCLSEEKKVKLKNGKKKNKKVEIISSEQMPEAVKYCSGDKCQVSYN